ncbi:hypothetical protein MLD38_036366 [Melastoma candidum]|uniref:Uncharacterized protein n=1 Tax=Melastoma candidum TaxID=119954 RepID=A0ACB9LKN7_9MYRT|nr:hypothetical protein MLD38_036366 [Melastoma candidum]
MKKLVLKLELEDGKAKQKAMRTVSTLQGIDSIVMDMKEKKMTVIGTVDTVHVVSKLRKFWLANIITVGPAKEPEKKEEPKPAPAAAAPAAEEGKKEEGKKEEGKKEEGKEEGGGKKEEGKGEEKKEEGKKEGGGGKKEEGGGEGGGGGKKEEGEAARKKPPQMIPQPTPEQLLEMVRARQYPPYMGNYPPYMAMANPYMNHHQPQMHPQMYHQMHPQMYHQMHHPQPTYYVQSVEENPNGCTIF